MDLSQIISPEDAIKLEDSQQYQFYFDLVEHAMTCVMEGCARLKSTEINAQEAEFIYMTAERLLYTLNALELRYLYIDENDMEIDVTESGYPNSSALRFLANEISFIEKDKTVKINEVLPTIDAFVDKLLVKKERITKEEIANAAFSLFHKSIIKERLHNNYIFGGIRVSDRSEYDFVAYWINYDILHNRPFVSFMYFDTWDPNLSLAQIDREIIAEAIGKTVSASPVKSVIYDIDKNLADYSPKLLKRVDLGPLASVFARDNRVITAALRKGIASKHLPTDAFAMELTLDKVRSIGVIELEAKFSFIKKKQIQNWGETESFSFLMAPHNVIQYLCNEEDETIRELAKHPIDVRPKPPKMEEL